MSRSHADKTYVTNDDGPPSDHSSPYVHPLVTALRSHGHTVSVVLPNTQRSWIGKSHMINEVIEPAVFDPAHLNQEISTSEELNPCTWILANGTPASCVQLGLKQFAKTTDPVDLVVSGPNYGKNSTAVFALSSGTIGTAMEAALYGKRAVALSFASPEDCVHDLTRITEACEHAIRVVGHLYENWDAQVHVYSVNVPLQKRTDKRRVFWTEIQQNSWGEGTAFREADESAGTRFQWAPKMDEISAGTKGSAAPEDSWALINGFTR